MSRKKEKLTFSDRDAEEGDLLYVASEYAGSGLYFPYHTSKALGGRGHDHYFAGVLEALIETCWETENPHFIWFGNILNSNLPGIRNPPVP